jgi:hypothetical protein
MMRGTKVLRALVAAAATFFAAWGVGACIAPTDSAPEKNACPPADEFPIVSQLLERRCGTLDCHGQPGRSLRIYGRYGLRKPSKADNPTYVPGGITPTTQDELDSNYHSVCGLEPEKMADVVGKKASVDTLTLVRKPRLTEAHKGGRVLPQNGDGDKCLVSWIKGAVDLDACDRELVKP